MRDDNTLIVAYDSAYRIRALAPAVGGLANGEIAMEDRGTGLRHVFAGDGRHLRTVDPRITLASTTASACAGRPALAAGTPTRVSEVCYDSNGVLAGIADRNGRITTFVHGSASTVTITSPDGQVTQLTKDADDQRRLLRRSRREHGDVRLRRAHLAYVVFRSRRPCAFVRVQRAG